MKVDRETLDELGVAPAGRVLSAADCRRLVGVYADDQRFRSTVDMARFRYGQGQYRYFTHPLPERVAELRAAFWPHLLPIAREWAERLGRDAPWPDDLDDWLERCHVAGQRRPTPLMLRYGPGDWNALHRDLYGELVFPLQVVVGLDAPGADYTGGEFVVVEQRRNGVPRPRRPLLAARSLALARSHQRCRRPHDGGHQQQRYGCLGSLWPCPCGSSSLTTTTCSGKAWWD